MQPSTLGSDIGTDAAPVKPPRTPSTSAHVERRSVRKIRFGAAEWRRVEEKARACGRAPARYVREVALGGVPKVSRTRGAASIIRELGAIAGALQALQQSLRRRDARDGGGPESDLTTPLDALVSRVLGVVERLM